MRFFVYKQRGHTGVGTSGGLWLPLIMITWWFVKWSVLFAIAALVFTGTALVAVITYITRFIIDFHAGWKKEGAKHG